MYIIYIIYIIYIKYIIYIIFIKYIINIMDKFRHTDATSLLNMFFTRQSGWESGDPSMYLIQINGGYPPLGQPANPHQLEILRVSQFEAKKLMEPIPSNHQSQKGQLKPVVASHLQAWQSLPFP